MKLSIIAILSGLGIALALDWTFLNRVAAPQRDFAVLLTAWLACALWFLSITISLQSTCNSFDHDRSRKFSAWGWWMLAIHFLVSFHRVHHWSLSEAYDFTERVGGWGGGVYLNFLVLFLWGCDLLATRRFPLSQRRFGFIVVVRSVIAFVVFNAAVVFAHTSLRWIAMLAFAWLAGQLARRIVQVRHTAT